MGFRGNPSTVGLVVLKREAFLVMRLACIHWLTEFRRSLLPLSPGVRSTVWGVRWFLETAPPLHHVVFGIRKCRHLTYNGSRRSGFSYLSRWHLAGSRLACALLWAPM